MTSASQAREAAALTLDVAARKARVSVSYLRRIERHGGATYALAMRLARLYGCSAHVFLYPTSSNGQSKHPDSALDGRNHPTAPNRTAKGQEKKRKRLHRDTKTHSNAAQFGEHFVDTTLEVSCDPL